MHLTIREHTIEPVSDTLVLAAFDTDDQLVAYRNPRTSLWLDVAHQPVDADRRLTEALRSAWHRYNTPLLSIKVDDEPETECTRTDFIRANSDDFELMGDVLALAVGQEITRGGGAAPYVRIRRVR